MRCLKRGLDAYGNAQRRPVAEARGVAAHRLGLRPTVFPSDEVLHVSARTEAMLIADGDPVGRLDEGTEVVIRRSPRPTLLIRLSDAPSFFDVLHEKLNWAGR